jgi:hypothetical protein
MVMNEYGRLDSVGSYKPVAIYFQESDCLEYVRSDIPTIYRRVDEFLTLIVSMEDREPIGFSLKGFRNFYNRKIATKDPSRRTEFFTLVCLIEEIFGDLGDGIFSEDKRVAYRKAIEIATDDEVELKDIPKPAYA